MNGEKKMTLSVDSEGNVLKCAKGADVSACGYKGGKICAKCGAMPVEVKMVPVDELEDLDQEEKGMHTTGHKKPMKGMYAPGDEEMGDEEEMPEDDMSEEDMEEESEEDMTDEKVAYLNKYGMNRYMKKYGKKPFIPMADDESELEEDASEKGWMGKRRKGSMMEMPEDDEMMEDESSEDEMDEEDKMMGVDPRRIRKMKPAGMKSESTDDVYLCAIERKSYSMDTPVCAGCNGGCAGSEDSITLMQAEKIAEKMLEGVAIDSGYSATANAFIVDVQCEDGSVKEAMIHGSTGELTGFYKLDIDEFSQKSALEEPYVINFYEAADIAVKAIDGHIIAIEPDTFEGVESYAVEIDGFDGKSYDVFVSLDGEVLGYDRYETDEAEEIEAEAAEIALKRAFSEETRMQMAEEGTAMPDGSYPIASESDLRNAIQAYGRAKDKEATKRHIMKRARQMNLEKLIPANWVMGGDTEKKTDGSVDADLMASLIEFELLQAEAENN
jgi:uncharacterized membrane protein YkoI